MHTNCSSPKLARKDVFNSFLVKNATYAGDVEIPCITTSNLLPERVITFSKAKNKREYDSWIHFYEDDSAFECLWNSPQKYLPIIKRYRGIISPDYSLYYDMPLSMQIWNTYRGKALAQWFQQNGVEIIPNVRWGDERTYELACLGIESCKTIAISTHGCIKTHNAKTMFVSGFDYVLNKLNPKNVVVYGRMPDKIFALAKMQGVQLISFESEFSLSRHREAK